MKNSKSMIKYMAAVAAAAMLFIGCSKDDNKGNEPTNPDQPSQPSQPSQPEVEPILSYVVYEANPRFFGTNNCLNALSAQLNRIKDLGCDILWIMPVCEPSTASQSVGSPYSIKNYEAINPKYGTVADLQNLVKEAHKLGLKVILDWVPNHTGWDNPWVKEHPDWFMQRNGEIISPPGQNWKDVAQLNYDNPEVGEAMAQAIEYWVTTADIDGFRFDYADSKQIPSSFWVELAKDLKAMKSDMLLLAESSNYSFYSYGYDMIYDWSSAPTISKAFTSGNATTIVPEGIEAVEKVPEGDSILRYVFNHDTMSEQPIDKYYGSIAALPAAYVCASMLNGTPLIYSGMDAKNLTGNQSFFTYKTLTFSDELTPVYRAINDAFKTTASVRQGTLNNFSSGSIVAFTRTTSTQKLLVVVNTSKNTQEFVIPMAFRYLDVEELISGESLSLPINIELPAYSYAIYLN